LILVARRLPLLEALSAQIVSKGGLRPLLISSDLGVAGNAAMVAQQALEQVGGIEILVNNAGTSIVGAQHIVGDGEIARSLFETNLWSPLALVAALTPQMRAQGSGTIVNVPSTLQAVPMSLIGYYSASKTALARATQVMRHELADAGLHVMEVVPGGTDTPTRHNDRFLPVRKGALPNPPLVTPASTAEAIIRGLTKRSDRVVHPASSYLPLELPFVGRLIGKIAAMKIDAGSDVVVVP
jgi:short-subunit dehydrogenase